MIESQISALESEYMTRMMDATSDLGMICANTMGDAGRHLATSQAFPLGRGGKPGRHYYASLSSCCFD
jgi:hypothetical protein